MKDLISERSGHLGVEAVSYRSFRRGILLASVASLSVLAASGPVLGAAFQLKENSAVGLGSAFAGAGSSADTPSTVFDNPAGMTQLKGLQIQLGGSLIAPSFTFKGTSTNAFGKPNSGDSGRDGGTLAVVPHGYVTYQVTPDLTIGLALTTPFGLSTIYGPNFIGRYNADKTDLRTININPAIAYQVTPWLSLGAGLSAQYGSAEFSTGINSSTIATSAFRRPTTLPDGYFRLKGDDWSVGYNLGALIQPTTTTNIGISYRSRVQHTFSGSAEFVVPAPLNLNSSFRNSAASAKVVLPDTATISVTQILTPAWTAYADFNWTNWEQFRTLNAYRDDGTLINSTAQHYHNGFFVSAGASYKVNEIWTLRGGIAFDQSPVTNSYRTARVPDQDRTWLAIGASYQAMPNLTLDAGYAHVFVRDSQILEVSTTGDTLKGSYKNSIDLVSFGARMKF